MIVGLSHWAVWVIVALSVAGVIFRPFGVKEVYPALAGAAALVVFGLLPPGAALAGVDQGVDVYLFLTGMMLLSELAASQGLFDWAAARTAQAAAGSAHRLFGLIYAMAVLITVFLSNDATAVVFTPAVAAMARAVQAAEPLPFLLICAFVANAASFVLPISNPANLVVYGARLPHLLTWLGQFLLPACVAILATFALLRFTQRTALRQAIEIPAERPVLSSGARRTGFGLIFTALLLMAASAFGFSLGLPTFLASILTLALVRANPVPLLKHISWSILPLVAGLFVMVAALDRTGTALALGRLLQPFPPWAAGLGLGVATNLVNNLPAGLLAGHALAHAPSATKAAALIGVDLGPNLSVTGSLATILWLTALRREGVNVSAWQFLRLGAVVMPPALLLALIVK
jgi:arsenical pump membrane protein